MTERTDETLQRLLWLPWTVLREVTPDGDVLLRVKEIPSAVGSGDSDEERVADLWEALTASLRALLHFGDPVPLPEGTSASWAQPSAQEQSRATYFIVDSLAVSTASVTIPSS